METSGTDAALTHLGKAEDRDGYYDLEHLPPLLEDEVRHWGLHEEVMIKYNDDLNFRLIVFTESKLNVGQMGKKNRP